MMIGVLVLATVCLLTILFSFLGTISCAALLGMMFGTIKQSKWQVIGISFVFPLVSFALARMLTTEKNLLLASLCFAVFWSGYLLTCAALCLERSQSRAALPHAANLGERDSPTIIGTPELALDSDLNELQGKWDRRSRRLDSSPGPEIIEVTRDHFLVTAPDGDGKPRTVCEGCVRVKHVGAYRAAAVSETGVKACDFPSRFSSAVWLYKISGHTLTIAWNFDDTGRDPILEHYERVAPIEQRCRELARSSPDQMRPNLSD
jgi:hypothetical protein